MVLCGCRRETGFRRRKNERNDRMNITDITNAINAHDEIAAQVEDGLVFVTKVDDRPIGNELIGDYIERIVGREVWSHLSIVNLDDSASCGSFKVID